MVTDNCKTIEFLVVKLHSETKYTTFFLNTVYLRRHTALFATEKIYYLFEPILQPEAAIIALIITSF